MTTIVLARHGETIWHAENRYAGASEVPLTGCGNEQAAQLASWAATAQLASVWTSTLGRAQLTARPCAQAAGAPLAVDARLRELDFGAGEGLTRAEMSERFPEALHAFHADPVAYHLPDGESPVAAAQRFTECLNDIATRHPDRRVLVVAHGTVIRLALCHLMGVPLREYRRLFPVIGNCAISEVRLSQDHFSLIRFNAAITRHQSPDPPSSARSSAPWS